MRPYAPGVSEDKLQLIVKDIHLGMTAEEAQASAKSNFIKLFGMADGGSVSGSYEAALRKKIEELMDDGYEFGEAVREAMRQGYKTVSYTHLRAPRDRQKSRMPSSA